MSQLMDKIYPYTEDLETVYLQEIISKPGTEVREYTMYNDFVSDPVELEKNNVLYRHPINHDRLVIGRFCSIACGARFILNNANRTLSFLSTYPSPLSSEEWGLEKKGVAGAWDNKGDIVVRDDVWTGYKAVITAGVTIGDGMMIGTRAVVAKDVLPYTIVGGAPARGIRKRSPEETVAVLFEMKQWDWPRE